ncbi:MAG: 4Fe-4S binding protein [Bacteroidales bacterium]|nr:4Fe-4S binding protein [Bacteroidales bacterium]
MKKFNLLLQKWYFPISLKYVSLVAYIVLVVTGLMAYSTDAEFLLQLRKTNLGNLIVWSYWWPGIVIMAIFFGRIWCMVCPVEIITTFFAKIGLKRKRPKWLLSGWTITIFYIIILFVGIQGFEIHRNPFFMAIYLLAIVGVSIIIGSIYEKNTFCRYVCPVGYLLGLYSRLSFFGWRVKNKSVCDTCKDKSCIHKKYQYNLNYKSCGVDLYPANISDNSNCILCAGCLKTCSKYQSHPNTERPNPQLTYIGFANDLFRLKPLKMAEMVFVLVVSGFVISEIWTEWDVTDKFIGYLPDMVINSLEVSNKFLVGFIKGSITFAIIPLIIWCIPFLISKIMGTTLKIKDYFLNYGIAFIPIIAAAHLDKAILKSTAGIPYFNHLFDDITGMTTAQRIIEKEIIIQQTPLWLNVGISILMTAIISVGIYLSYKVIRLQNKKQDFEKSVKATYLIPILYGSIFLIMILIWRWNM